MKSETRFIGQSSAFLDSVERATQAAALDRPVLIVGERGTGKELIAERVHRHSNRWDGPLIIMNCAALPETLIEAELFGHEAGAFTGAARARAGRFEEADGGTLFLDELGTLSMAAQERLLRAVEYGEVTRIGASKPLKVDCRIVGATNEHLPAMVDCGRFRADLLDRLSFEVITLPPLRVREGDIRVLTDHFAQRISTELGHELWQGFSARAHAELEGYSWPGNVRELRNVVERAVYRWLDPDTPVDAVTFDPFASAWQPRPTIMTSPTDTTSPGRAATGQVVTGPVRSPNPPAQTPPEPAADLRAAVEAYERTLLTAGLERCRFNQKATADALGLSYDQLRHALRKHGLN